MQTARSLPVGSRHRQPLPFYSVNRSGAPGFRSGMQRHHLLPRQLLGSQRFFPRFEAVGRECIGFDDFRRNGLLLPAHERAVNRLRLPLHRGPHRQYNDMVEQRVGQIEHSWQALRLRDPARAGEAALMRLHLLQQALRLRLLDTRRTPYRLNSKDPLGSGLDFSDLDAMAETLWAATGPKES